MTRILKIIYLAILIFTACKKENIVDCDDCSIFIPDAFTPNLDGNNDVLLIRTTNIQTIDFKIYNKDGIKVLETNNLRWGWDGTYKGRFCPVGLYRYYIKAMSTSGQAIKLKGEVQLIR